MANNEKNPDKRFLGKLVHKTERERKEIKKTLRHLMHQQLLCEIKDNKFMDTVEIMESIHESNVKQIGRTYRYLFEDEIERVDTKDEVCREYK